ncbi:MAG TPA: SDR family oxidoreductase [Bacillales bacterium]|nr:SDR family oxidoreductase [Bacillales bacterium]
MKVALVTGTSSGFGLLISLALAEKGYFVAATMRHLDKKGPLMEQAKQRGLKRQFECIQLDVTKDDEIKAAVSAILEEHGSIDVLVNNAGYAAGGFVEEIPDSEWRSQFETNVFGLIAVTRAVLPSMRERGKGKIINMSSVSGRMALPGLGPYSASKFAVEGFSESLRLEMKAYGVDVVLVEPGSFKTDIWAKGVEDVSLSEHSAYREKTERMKRMVTRVAETAGNPDDVAQLVARIAEREEPDFRYPIGKGIKSTLKMRAFMPWKWLERAVLKRM